MFNKFAAFATLALALSVYAQDSSAEETGASSTGSVTGSAPASTPSVSPCFQTCLQKGVDSGACSSLTDIPCFCSDTEFQTTVAQCIATSCPDEIGSATALQQAQCANVSASGSSASVTATGASSGSKGASQTGSATNTSKTSPASSGASSPSGSPSSNAASPGSAVSFGFAPVLAAGVSLVGAVLGASVVL